MRSCRRRGQLQLLQWRAGSSGRAVRGLARPSGCWVRVLQSLRRWRVRRNWRWTVIGRESRGRGGGEGPGEISKACIGRNPETEIRGD
jgi:hypothetical protein